MSHAKPSTTTFQSSYLLEFPWVKEHPTLRTMAICSWCHRDINIGGMGKTALRSHTKSAKHILNEKNRKKSLPLKMFLKDITEGNSLPGPSTSREVAEMQSSTASSQKNITIQPNQTPVVATRPQSAMKQYLLSESVTKSEVFWCLQIVVNHIPFAVAARCANSFKIQFPDSEIASKLKLDYTKVGYLVVFGLAPHFEKQLQQQLKSSSHIVLCFDESLNKVSQRQQMDLHIRWWDSIKNQVTTRYYTSVFLGHSTALNLLQGIKSSLSAETMKKIIQISMDGPNVNKKLFNDFQEELSTNNNPLLINIGSCGLHTLHGAFKTGMIITKWDLVGFLRALYNLFKDSPARRADFTYHSTSTTFPLKFCAVRWVESGRVAERAMAILPCVRKYVDAVVKYKKEPGCNSFVLVKEKLNDKLLPAKLAFFISMCCLYEPFLKEFQNDAPMAPLLYNEINSLLLTFLEKVVKKEHLDSLTVKNRIDKIDLSNTNLIPTKQIDLGFATKHALRSCEETSDLDKLNFKRDARDAILVMIKKIIEKSPIKYPLSKAITCLDPGVIKSKGGETKLTKCLEELVAKKWITGVKADAVKRQYLKLFSIEHILEECKNYKRNNQRLDDFFVQLINVEGSEEYKDLKYFIELILTLSHGNASVERGFSINKECIVENLKEESLVALRKVCDGVSAAGGVETMEITTDLIHAAKNAHARYTEHLARKREEIKDKVNAEKERKQAAKERQELETERLQVLAEARKRAAELDERIVELSKKCKS